MILPFYLHQANVHIYVIYVCSYNSGTFYDNWINFIRFLIFVFYSIQNMFIPKGIEG